MDFSLINVDALRANINANYSAVIEFEDALLKQIIVRKQNIVRNFVENSEKLNIPYQKKITAMQSTLKRFERDFTFWKSSFQMLYKNLLDAVNVYDATKTDVLNIDMELKEKSDSFVYNSIQQARDKSKYRNRLDRYARILQETYVDIKRYVNQFNNELLNIRNGTIYREIGKNNKKHIIDFKKILVDLDDLAWVDGTDPFELIQKHFSDRFINAKVKIRVINKENPVQIKKLEKPNLNTDGFRRNSFIANNVQQQQSHQQMDVDVGNINSSRETIPNETQQMDTNQFINIDSGISRPTFEQDNNSRQTEQQSNPSHPEQPQHQLHHHLSNNSTVANTSRQQPSEVTQHTTITIEDTSLDQTAHTIPRENLTVSLSSDMSDDHLPSEVRNESTNIDSNFDENAQDAFRFSIQDSLKNQAKRMMIPPNLKQIYVYFDENDGKNLRTPAMVTFLKQKISKLQMEDFHRKILEGFIQTKTIDFPSFRNAAEIDTARILDNIAKSKSFLERQNAIPAIIEKSDEDRKIEEDLRKLIHDLQLRL